MRLPVDWLHDHVRPELGASELADRLTMTGTAVEAVRHHGVAALENFVVGRVLSAQRHPEADRLTVCHVAVGEGDTARIVCGAPNVAEGQTVAVARPGAVMPDGTRLKSAKLRGVVSEGMILAEDELAIGAAHDGILVLDDELVPGTPLLDVLPISTEVLELEITPNRPDCLGVYGVAREVHAATGAELGPPPWADDPAGDAAAGSGPPPAEVVVEAGELCPRFTARVFEDVAIAESPAWLKARLTAAGQRPINNVVDITNYVMLLTGQPLHAFDLDRVAGGRLTVRRARAGETMTTLDDVERALDPEMVVIEDAEGPTSIAGVMGGARSEVSPATTRVLLEAATWDGPNIHATSGRLGLRTEASGRFEKGLSPELAMEAQIVASRLLVELAGARPVGETIDVGDPPPAPARLRLRDERVRRLLGVAVPPERQRDVLERLGFIVETAGEGDGVALDVTVPHWRRFDVTREADLIEEVARMAALEELPATLPARRGASGLLTDAQRARRRADDVLVGRGLHEIAGWSFTAPAALDRLRLPERSPLRALVALANPMSEDESILRPTLLTSLLDALRRNRDRGQERIALFERGTVYRSGGDPALEHQSLGAVLMGPAAPATWRTPAPPDADLFAAKALAGAVLDALRVDWHLEEPAGEPEPYLHPGRSGIVVLGDDVGTEPVGWIGELHPLVARAWDVDERVAAFELDLDRVLAAARHDTTYEDVTTFPPVRQDIAVSVADGTAAAAVVAGVRAGGGRLLRSAEVFDRYELGEGRISLALHLEFAAPDRTLTDEEVARLREKIVARLSDELGAELRG